MKIQTRFKVLRYWGYEHAYVDSIFLTFERDGEWNAVQDFLCRQNGVNMDNKVVFEVVSTNDGPQASPIYIGFKDFSVHIGTGIRPYHGIELKPGEPMPRKKNT